MLNTGISKVNTGSQRAIGNSNKTYINNSGQATTVPIRGAMAPGDAVRSAQNFGMDVQGFVDPMPYIQGVMDRTLGQIQPQLSGIQDRIRSTLGDVQGRVNGQLSDIQGRVNTGLSDLQSRLQDPRGPVGMFSRGVPIYNGGNTAAHRGGGIQFGRPKNGSPDQLQNAISRRLGLPYGNS